MSSTSSDVPNVAAAARSWFQRLKHEHSAATFAFCFLVAVGVSKTLLTKLIFTHSPTPVAFSVLSCFATNVCLTPILMYQGKFKMLTRTMAPGFAAICVAIAVDLACQNVALAILSVALQQCIKATLPTATVLVERVVRGKRVHPYIYATVAAICIGPILVACQSSWKARSEAGSQLYGAIMMLVAVIGGAFKYVLCHKAIKDFREELGVLAFTFWVETFVGLMLLPWALLNGEAYAIFFGEHAREQSFGEWVLLWGAGAFGGVRVVSQFMFLAATSATSLAMSSMAMQALTIILGIVCFHTPVTVLLVLGVACTIVTSALYTWLKTSSALDKPAHARPKEKKPKEPEKRLEVAEASMKLKENDSAAVEVEVVGGARA